MRSGFQKQFDVLVIGAGPAGIAAAVRAAEKGVNVGVVDDNLTAGGQIWRGRLEEKSPEARFWLDRFAGAGITTLSATRVFDYPETGILLAEHGGQTFELSSRKLIIATGARERFLAFPGWTLPNVMGGGGLQAMVKSGLPIRGKRVVVAGTGPLSLAVAAYLRKHGAEVPILCEQASWARLAGFAAGLARSPEKIVQGWRLNKDLFGVRFVANSWPVRAHGSEKLESITISRSGSFQEIACDYLACGFHLVPNAELAALIGCEVRNGFVSVDENQHTTVAGVYCAGEPTGIAGVEGALVEGQIAGLAATDRMSEARRLFAERNKTRRFAARLERAFGLRAELKTLPEAETVICRCEDVRYARLEQHKSWRAAKLHTRCGMGPCQGRVCGPATQFLFGWNAESVRPPIFPATVASLATTSSKSS